MGVQLIGVSHYVEDDAYPIESNPIENGIRPVALGRKNWLFARSETAGKRAAAFMSLLATAKAKANGHEPNAWLTDVWLPTTLDRDVQTLLPQHWKPGV